MNINWIFFFAGILCSPCVSALSVAPLPEQLLRFSDTVGPTCTKVSSHFVDDPHYQPALKEHPVDIEKICACSKKIILSDERLIEQFSVENEELSRRLRSTELGSYLLLKTTSSIFECFYLEVNKSLLLFKF